MYTLGFCPWDLPAALLLAVILSVYLLRRKRLKDKCENLEMKITQKQENNTLEQSDQILQDGL